MDLEKKAYLKKAGGKFKKIRISKKLKHVDLANICNFDQQKMYHIEVGRNNLNLTSVRKIAEPLMWKSIKLLIFEFNSTVN